jgi:hypothetical protein
MSGINKSGQVAGYPNFRRFNDALRYMGGTRHPAVIESFR